MSHIFYESVRVFLKNRLSIRNRSRVFEKAVVRPEFSRKGKVEISETALSQMVLHCISEYDKNLSIDKLTIISDGRGYKLNVGLVVPFGIELAGNMYHLREYIIENIERYTGILIEELNITIGNVSIKEKEKKY
jgi:uncharacterized alkaline shock family protein YloU